MAVTQSGSMSWIDKYFGGLRLSAWYTAPSNQNWSAILSVAFEDETHKDVTLNVNSEQVTTHRLILSSHSPVFEAMFRYSFAENLSGHVDLTESFGSVKLLHQFLRYLYEKPLELDLDNVIGLLDVSSRYFIRSLTDLCSQYLFKHLCPSNCLSIWLAASLYCLRDLEFVCRHLFSEVFPFIEIQNSVVTALPSWFIMDILMKSNLPDVFPILFPTLIIVWLLGNFKQREAVVIKLFVSLSVSEQTILTIFSNLNLNQTDRGLVRSVFARAFVFTAGSKNRPKEFFCRTPYNEAHHQNGVSGTNRHQYYANRQYFCVMLLNETSNIAAFYCIEHQKWRTLHLPVYNGTTLGIVAGNLLVRVVAKGSSANLFNLRTRKSTQTPCVLTAVSTCEMEFAFLPTRTNFFLSNGQLHVGLVVRKFRSLQLVLFRFDHLLNRWYFLMGFPLLRNLNHVTVRTYSTRRNLVYLVVTVRPFTSALHSLNAPSEFSHVFVVDLLLLEVVGSSCGYFGSSILNNDCFILTNKLHFVTNRQTLLGHRDKSPTTAKVLVINPYDQKYLHVLYPVRAPRLERLPIVPLSRKDLFCSESLSTVKESILCVLHQMGPYVSNMFIFDMEHRKWFQTPSPPPIFKRKPSKPMLIYAYVPVSTLIPETDPSIISADENFFQEWQLRKRKY